MVSRKTIQDHQQLCGKVWNILALEKGKRERIDNVWANERETERYWERQRKTDRERERERQRERERDRIMIEWERKAMYEKKRAK